jgi:hypothetical protein
MYYVVIVYILSHSIEDWTYLRILEDILNHNGDVFHLSQNILKYS